MSNQKSTMAFHRNNFEQKFGPIASLRLVQEHPSYEIFGWDEVELKNQPYIEIIPSWSAARKSRRFIRKMDIVFNNICRFGNIE